MKLFKISQDVNNDYDTFDSAIVAAETEEDARNIRPRGDERYPMEDWEVDYDWARPEDVKVEYIGEAKEGTEKGVILSSFNAG